MKPAFDPRCRYRLLAAIISHTVWLYHVFSFIRFLFVTVYPYTGRDMSIMARYPWVVQQPDQTPLSVRLLCAHLGRSARPVNF